MPGFNPGFFYTMLNIENIKPTKNNIIVKLIGLNEVYNDGIFLPQKHASQANEAVILALPDDKIYIDQNLDDLPERKILMEQGDIVLLNHNITDAAFDAIVDGKEERCMVIKPYTIIGFYKKSEFREKV